jgi:hypothetical protein
VARWFAFTPNIPIWVNLGGPYADWKMLIYFMVFWNILLTFWIFYDHWVNLVFIWYIFTVLVSCTNKNLATLHRICRFHLSVGVVAAGGGHFACDGFPWFLNYLGLSLKT